MGRYRDIAGMKFGFLTAESPTNDRSASGAVVWVFRCDCGRIKSIDSNSVTQGRVKSCGCLLKPHGMTDSRLFHIWVNMRQRCSNPRCPDFKYYGGKGVEVCLEWQTFGAFSAWATSNGYSDVLTIDRVDSSGNYSPENCRWASYQQQARNSSRNRTITANGVTKLLCEWAELTGLSRTRIELRIDRYGYTPEEALVPRRKSENRKKIVLKAGKDIEERAKQLYG